LKPKLLRAAEVGGTGFSGAYSSILEPGLLLVCVEGEYEGMSRFKVLLEFVNQQFWGKSLVQVPF
jgi:hypothetical protein